MKKLLIPIMASGLVFLLAGSVKAAVPNPADVYCLELGYEAKTITEETGGQYSVCVFPDGNSCDAWKFLKGLCGEEYSYCAKNGYDQVTKSDGKNAFSKTYAVCVEGSTEIGNPLDLMGITERLLNQGLEEHELPPAQSSPDDARDLLDGAALPSSFDWRTYQGFDWMTPVKNQSACGSCWAFGSVGTVEAAYNIQQGQPNLDINLSEEYANADCNGNGKSGCCGGRHEESLDAIRDHGVPDEACMVYQVSNPASGSNGYGSGICSCGTGNCAGTCPVGAGGSDDCSRLHCDDACFDVGSRLVWIDDWYGAGAGDRDAMKANLIAHGPLTAALLWGSWSSIDADDVHYCGCGDGCGTNHCVIITGWDDTVGTDGAWIIKNSHGNNDGPANDGYRLIAYGDCNLETRPVWVAPADIYFPSISIPGDVVFDGTCLGGTSYETLNICNTGKADLSVYDITSDDSQFQVIDPLMDCSDVDNDGNIVIPDECSGGYPVLISPDFCYPFEVQFSPTGAGSQTATLTVRSSDIGKPAITVQASGDVPVPDMEVFIADAGDFGDVCVGDYKDLDMTIQNNGGCDLIVDSITDNHGYFIIPDGSTPLVVEPGNSVRVPIRYAPEGVGSSHSATITVSGNDGSTTLSVTGTSPPGDINVAIANSGDFGKVCKGAQADLDLTLFNQGQCDLEISSITLVGADSDWFDLPDDLQMPLVLSPDADFRFPVRFSPDECSDTARTAQVQITSDDPDEGTVNINVSGISPCPNLVIDSTDLYGFPATVVDMGASMGCFSDRSAVLRNNGECPLTINDISAAGLDYTVVSPTAFPIILPSGEETLEVVVRFTPQADADPLAPSEVLGLMTVLSDDPDGPGVANLCGESSAQSGVRILVTNVTSGTPMVVPEVDSLNIKSTGRKIPSPVNLQFTDHLVSSALVCGNVIEYHVDQETLPAVGTTGSNPKSSYLAKAREGNLGIEESFSLGQCEFREFQLQLQASETPDPGDCLLLPKGASCENDGQCCSGKCKGPEGGKTCK